MEPLADDDVNWNEAVEIDYLVHQCFRYDYPGPIADLHHRLVVVPRSEHGDQRLIDHRIAVTPETDESVDADSFGNPVSTFFARRVEGVIEFSHWSLVRRIRDAEPREPIDGDDPSWRTPATSLTAADATLRQAARDLRAAHPEPEALARAIVSFVHRSMRYVQGVTDVETTAAAAFALGAGVCQDYTHIALALARRVGLAARYVSGHLIGEGATHAWIEFLFEEPTGPRILAYDPTNDCAVSMRYVVVAIGRDYSDVAPTSGVYTAPYVGARTATTRVSATRVRYSAA